jgi:hypothetical protein
MSLTKTKRAADQRERSGKMTTMQEVILHRDVSVALRSTLRDCANGMPEELVVNSLALNNVPVEITRTVIGALLAADWIARRDGRLYYVSYDETKDQKL